MYVNLVKTLVLCWISFLLLPIQETTAQKVNWKKVHLLFYTKNGKGYVHDNIPNSILAIKELSIEYGFQVDTSEDPSIFNDENLKKYDVIVFSNTNNDVFDTDAQRVSFMRYIQAGGGFAGIHSASGTERNWKWFKQMLGATFYWHDVNQPFTVNIIDPTHPSVAHLPSRWERTNGDEFYYLKQMAVNLHVIAFNDATTLKGEDARRLDTFTDGFPSVWCHEFDGGRSWYTSLGHNKEDYFDPVFRQHMMGGITWAIGQQKPRNYRKAYATSPSTPLQIR